MSVFFSDEAIARLVQEDVPYLDLTTYGLGIGKQPGKIEFSTRHPMTICATEEAARVLKSFMFKTSPASGAKKSLYLKVGKNPTPSVGLSLIANGRKSELRIGFIWSISCIHGGV
ncbi:hypothetical protein [Nostoc sp. CHAB 5715]|uniref:hypothetical protein n=1 Tax=Nostoc sp. CHAB 5715 TaxID=2780400 RepID=UPI001E550652|nr:hypothetical protein [Nostoc sp. CHAB 5715]MCC5624469.1 hypothetical protein [Nostoc sp. CHAB 5715]